MDLRSGELFWGLLKGGSGGEQSKLYKHLDSKCCTQGQTFYCSANLALSSLISEQQFRATIGLYGLMTVVPGLRPAVVEVNGDRSGR